MSGDIVWRLSDAESAELLDVLTVALELLDLDDDDPKLLRLQHLSDELSTLIRQRREYDASLQSGLVGLS